MPITILRITALAVAADDSLSALNSLIHTIHKARHDYLTGEKTPDQIFTELAIEANPLALLKDPQSVDVIMREMLLTQQSLANGQRAYQRAVTAQHRNRRALRAGKQPTSPAQTYHKNGDYYNVNNTKYSNDQPGYIGPKPGVGIGPNEQKFRDNLAKFGSPLLLEPCRPPSPSDPSLGMPTDPDELAHMVEVLRKTEELERGEKEIDFDIPAKGDEG